MIKKYNYGHSLSLGIFFDQATDKTYLAVIKRFSTSWNAYLYIKCILTSLFGRHRNYRPSSPCRFSYVAIWTTRLSCSSKSCFSLHHCLLYKTSHFHNWPTLRGQCSHVYRNFCPETMMIYLWISCFSPGFQCLNSRTS